MISRRIFAAAAMLCAFIAPAHAQKTAAQIAAEIAILFPDNSVGAITPSGLRSVTLDTIHSIMPSVAVGSGNVACFDGTTGLLKDCATATALLPLAPTASTILQGLSVNQTLPSGSAGLNNPYSANLLSIVNNGYQTPPGGATDPFGLFPVVSGLRVDYQSAGSGVPNFPIQIGGLFATSATSAGQQLVGLNGTTYTNIDSAANDSFWPVIGYANVGPAANIKAVIGVEAEVASSPTASILYRIGVGAASQGAGIGSLIDAAFALSAQDDKYGAAAPWSNAFVFWNTGHAPYSNAAFISDAPFTASYFVKLDNVTFSNKIFDFGSSVFQMDGSGNTTFGGTVLANSAISLVKTANSPTVFSINNLSTGTAATASTTITNNLDQSSFGLAGSNYTTLSQLANRAYVHSGPANNGIILDAGGSKPIDFYINNARVGGFTAGGALTLTAGYPTTGLTGTLQAAQEPAHTGGCTNSAGSLALSCTNNTTIIGGGATNTILAGATGWVGVGLICNATEAFCYLPQPQAGTISNLYVNVGVAPGAAQTYTVTMRKNASNQTVTCTISGASATSCNDTTHSFSVAAADNVSVQIAASGGAATVSVANFGFKLATTSP